MPFDFEIFYANQFISDEIVPGDFVARAKITALNVEHTPVIPGTMTGFVYVDNIAVQSFVADGQGQIHLEDIVGANARNKVLFEGSYVNHAIGGINLHWEKPVTETVYLVVSYEYDYENSTSETQSRFTHSYDKSLCEKVVWKTDGF